MTDELTDTELDTIIGRRSCRYDIASHDHVCDIRGVVLTIGERDRVVAALRSERTQNARPTEFRYLCTSGHHVVSRDVDLIECDAPVQANGRPYVTNGSLDGVARCGGRLSRYESPDWFDEDAVAELERERTQNLRMRAALEPIAARACENYTSGPGSCQRNGRKPVTDGPEFTGTADEICYPCFAWSVLPTQERGEILCSICGRFVGPPDHDEAGDCLPEPYPNFPCSIELYAARAALSTQEESK